MKKLECTQPMKLRAYPKTSLTTSIFNHHALICEGILVGDLKIGTNDDLKDESVMVTGGEKSS